MAFYTITLSLLLFVFSCSRPQELNPPKPVQEAVKEDQYKKELDEIRKTIKGEVKIKLKKDGKADSFSWEISGKDANEVLKANEILTRKLPR
jgi:outer membrane biogenesis lipoprotein LolB